MSDNRNQFHRRSFLGMTTAAAAASALAAPTLVPRSVLAEEGRPGANDRVTVGCVSTGHRARLLMEQLPEAARLVAVADCNLPQALQLKKEKGADWATYGSHYPLLDRKDIDAVIIAGQEYQRDGREEHLRDQKAIHGEPPLFT